MSTISLRTLMILIAFVLFRPYAADAQCNSVAGITPKVPSATICSGTIGYVFATGLPVVKWTYQDNHTGAWTENTSTIDNYNMVMVATVPTVRTFKAIIYTATCGYDTTGGVDLNIVPPSYSTNSSIKLSASKYTVCAGGQVKISYMNQSYTTTQWLYRDNGGNWTSFSISTGQSVTQVLPHTNSTVVRDYRAIVQHSGTCVQDSTDIVTVTISVPQAGNNYSIKPLLSPAVSICGGNSVTLSTDWPFELGNWLYRDGTNQNWQVLGTGITPTADNATSVNVTTTRTYRVMLMNVAQCKADTSDMSSITINPIMQRTLSDVSPKLTSGLSICPGTNQNFILQGFNSIQWFYRDSANGTWTLFGTSSPSNTLASNISSTKDIIREVRVLINNTAAFCSYDTTAIVSYRIKSKKQGNNLVVQPFVSSAQLCAGATVQVTAGTGTQIAGWLWRDQSNGGWNPIASGAVLNDNNTLVNVPTTRSYRALLGNITCGFDTSVASDVQIIPSTAGSTIPIQPKLNQREICSGEFISGDITIQTPLQAGQWIYRDNANGLWTIVNNQTTSPLNDSNTLVNVLTQRQYAVLIRNFETFKLDTSQSISITIKPAIQGNLSISPVTARQTVCNYSKVSFSINLPAEYSVQHWLTKEATNQAWSKTGTGKQTLLDSIGTTNSNRMYRVVASNPALCRLDTSDMLTVDIKNLGGRTLNEITPTISAAEICSGTSITLTVNTPYGSAMNSWMYRDNGSQWKTIPSSNVQYVETQANTKVLSATTRNYRVIFSNSTNCTIDTTNSVALTIRALTSGITTSQSPRITNSINCAGNVVAVSIATFSGSVQKWVYRDNGNDWKDFNSTTTSVTVNDIGTFVTSPVFREYRAILTRTGTCLIDTTQITGTTIKPYTYGNAPSTLPTTSNALVCGGLSYTVNLSSFNGFIVTKWIYRLNQSGEWRETDVASATASLNETAPLVASPTQKTYRAIMATPACSYDTTASVTVSQYPRTYNNLLSITPTSATPEICSGTSILLTLNGSLPSGASVRKWLFRDNNVGEWIEITGSTSLNITHTNTTVTAPTIRTYRIIVNNVNACSFDSSGIFPVKINPVKRGIISSLPFISPTSICNFVTPPAITLSGYNGSFVKWLMNTNGTGWVDFPYTTNTNSVNDYTFNPTLTSTRSYRAIINNALSCSIDSSNTVTTYMGPMQYGYQQDMKPLASALSICQSRPVTVSVTVPSGFIIYKWLFRNNNNAWQEFPDNSGNALIIDSNTYVAQPLTRSYRALFYSSGNCRIDSSDITSVLIKPLGLGAKQNILPVTNDTNRCSGSPVNLTIGLPTGKFIHQWIFSDNGSNGPWLGASNSMNMPTFLHPATQVNITTNRNYAAVISDNQTCLIDTSASVKVVLRPVQQRYNAVFSITAPDSACAGNAIVLKLHAPFIVQPRYWWQRLNNGNWTLMPGNTADSTISDHATLLAKGSSKTYKTVVYSETTCSIDTVLLSHNVYIKEGNFGISGSSIFLAGADTICSGTQLTVYSGGTVERWLYSDGDKEHWQPIADAFGSPLIHSATIVQTSGWRYYRAIHSNLACYGDSSMLDSVFIKTYAAGKSQLVPTIAVSSICTGNSFTVNAIGNAGVIQRWLYRDNSGPWQDFVISSNTNVAEFNTFVTASLTRDYRMIELRSCSYDTSEIASILIIPKSYGKDTTKVPTVASASVCAGDPVTSITIAGVAAVNVVQWLSRDNGGNWKLLNGASTTSISDNNTAVNSTTVRDYVMLINNPGACRIDTSAVLSVTLKPVQRGNSNRVPVVPSSVCSGNTFTISMNVATDTTVKAWLYNLNNSSYVDRGFITPVTSSSINDLANPAMSTISYRAILYKASACRMDTTLPSIVTPKMKINGTDTTVKPTGLSTYCALSTNSIVSVTPGTGNTVSRWIYSDNGSDWTSIQTTATNLNGAIATQQVLNRIYRVLINKGVSCGIDSSAAFSVTINPPLSGTDTAFKTTVSAPKSICSGASVLITATSVGASINKWLYRELNASSWTALNTVTSTTMTDNYSSFSAARRYAFIGYNASTCRTDTSGVTDTAYFNSRVRGIDTSMKVSASALSICAGTAITLTHTPGSGNTILQWLYSDDAGANWNLLSTSTAVSIGDFNTDVPKSVTRLYRVIVKKGSGCNNDSSDIVSVSIRARILGTDFSVKPTLAKQTICSGTPISAFISLPGGRVIQKWITQVNGGPWTTYISGGPNFFNEANTTVSNPENRRYAVLVTGTTCSVDTSDFAEANLFPLGNGTQPTLIPGTSTPQICSGSKIKVGISISNGSTLLNWMYRDNDQDAWTMMNISTDSISDTNTFTSIVVNRKYRALMLNPSGCGMDTSGTLQVNIQPITYGTNSTVVLASKSIVCGGNNILLSISPPSGYSIVQWLRKTNFQNWVPFTNQTTVAVTDTNTTFPSTITRHYTVRLKNNSGCNTDTAVAVSIEVKPISYSSTNSYAPYCPVLTVCSGTPVSISLFGFPGVVKQWLIRDSLATSWRIVNRSENTIPDTPTAVSTTNIREYRALLFSTDNCRYDTSAAFKLTINPNVPGNAPSITPTSSSTLYCSGNPISLNATGFINNGKVNSWLYRDNNGAWIVIDSSNTSSYQHQATVVSNATTRRYRALVHTGCTTDTTAALTVSIDVYPYKPIVLRKPGTDTLLCSETATTYQWKLNGSPLSGSTKIYHVAMQNGKYVVEIGNSSGCKIQSDSIVIANVGLDVAEEGQRLSVYPNPSHDGLLTLHFSHPVSTHTTIEISNIIGSIIQQVPVNAGQTDVNINLQNQSEGVYLMQVMQQGTSHVMRIVIAK